MITLADLAALAGAHRSAIEAPVGDLLIGGRRFDTDVEPVVMGTVNLSRDSTYRESIAVSTESAIRKGRVMAAEGAQLIDIGAESTTAKAVRVGAADQAAALVPVVAQLAKEDVLVSVETYEPEVAEAGLAAGASVLNMTGVQHEDAMLDLVAEYEATVILCYSGGANVREVTDVELDADPIPALIDHFGDRIARARGRGVERIVIDPGMGFYYGNLTDPLTRARHQARVILAGFRLRELGVPMCNALPHAFDIFEENFRSAEAFYAVLARLGGTGILRTHEVSPVLSVLRALGTLDVPR
ncbi:MAG: dihydropteroate synthase [Actinomycetales bacterium]|nr:dihydropteroate synthase [Actinomycetales bacterium]